MKELTAKQITFGKACADWQTAIICGSEDKAAYEIIMSHLKEYFTKYSDSFGDAPKFEMHCMFDIIASLNRDPNMTWTQDMVDLNDVITQGIEHWGNPDINRYFESTME